MVQVPFWLPLLMMLAMNVQCTAWGRCGNKKKYIIWGSSTSYTEIKQYKAMHKSTENRTVAPLIFGVTLCKLFL